MTSNLDVLKTIDTKNFVRCNIEELAEGDIVGSFTYTHSQKYFDKPGFEEYNMIKYGILHKINDPYGDSIITIYNSEVDNFEQTRFYSDPGSSGGFFVMKYIS